MQQRLSALLIALSTVLVTVCSADGSFITPKELKRGDRGYGLSVFEGTRIEKFDVEVIDVIEKSLPSQDMVLIRISRHGKGFDVARSGVIAGMSGSPIYIRGKLLGALAYGWGFQKGSTAGVTPISNMIADMNRPLEKASGTPRPIRWGESSIRPCVTPILISGASPHTLSQFRKQFEHRGFLPVLGGGNAAKPNANDKQVRLEPGSAIGVNLMTGDMSFTAIGTVTHVDKISGKVLAFGHPFFQAGPVQLPMTTARVHTVIESLSSSFKLGSSIQSVGTLIADRQASIVGQIGESPKMIPIEFTIRNQMTQAKNTYRCQVVDHHLWTSILVNMALSNFANAADPSFGPNTKTVQMSLRFRGHEPIEFQDTFSGSLSTFSSRLLAPLSALLNNPFKRVHLEGAEVKMELAHENRAAQITSILLQDREVEDGQTVYFRVVLEGYDRKPYIAKMSVPIPRNLPPGRYTLQVSGGHQSSPNLPRPRSIEDLLRLIRSVGKGQQIVASLNIPKMTLYHQSKPFKDLPPSVLGTLLASNRSADLQIQTDQIVRTIDTPLVVSGRASITLDVRESTHQHAAPR